MPQPAPQPAPNNNNWILYLLIIWLVLKPVINGPAIGGSSPTKTLPAVPSVLVLYDDDAKATLDLDTNHKGQADVITSIADGSAKDWVKVKQGGIWLTYGLKEPAPDAKMSGDWASEAYTVAKAAGKTPYMVASSPKGKGFSGLVPDGTITEAQAATLKALAPIGVK